MHQAFGSKMSKIEDCYRQRYSRVSGAMVQRQESHWCSGGIRGGPGRRKHCRTRKKVEEAHACRDPGVGEVRYVREEDSGRYRRTCVESQIMFVF